MALRSAGARQALTRQQLRQAHTGWLYNLGYRPEWLAEKYPVVSSGQPYKVDHVAFGSEDHDLEDSCIATEFRQLDGKVPPDHKKLKLLASPLVWEVDARLLRVWRMTPRRFEWLDDVPYPEVPKYLAKRKPEYAPERILQAKRKEIQLDFVDMGLLEFARDATRDVLHEEFGRAIARGEAAYKRVLGRELVNGEFRTLVLGALQIMAARAFEDKLGLDCGRSGRDVDELLESVDRKVAGALPTGEARRLPKRVARLLLDDLTSRLRLSSPTAGILSRVYTETGLDRTTRRALGAFYTPPAVAEYMFSVLPVNEIDPREWMVFDPACGSGNLLVAAYHKLSTLSDVSLAGKGHGLDKDPFACNAGAANLAMCKVPAISGWRVHQGNLFRTDPSELGMTGRPTIIVANPPFGRGDGVKQRAAIALMQSIDWLAEGGLLGFVLPENFAVTEPFDGARERLLDECEVIDVLRLPRDIIPKSREAIQVICARKTRRDKRRHTWVKTVSVADRDAFKEGDWRALSRAFRYPSETWRHNPRKELTGTHVFEVLEEVKRLDVPPLGRLHEVHHGFPIVPGSRQKAEVDLGTAGAVPCIWDSKRVSQFRLSGPEEGALFQEYAKSTGQLAHLRRTKVVFPRTSTAGIPWRIAAAYVEAGSLVYQAFCYAIPRREEEEDEAVRALVALLNSKVANAWVYTFALTRGLRTGDVEAMPCPKFGKRARRRLAELACRLQECLNEEDSWEERCALVEEVDEVVYDAYRIGPAGRDLIEELFYGERRPGFGDERELPQGAVPGRQVRDVARGALEVVGRVAFVDRGDGAIYCDLHGLGTDRLVRCPVDDFPVELQAAGLAFRTRASRERDGSVVLSPPRRLASCGITYGEGLSHLRRTRSSVR